MADEQESGKWWHAALFGVAIVVFGVAEFTWGVAQSGIAAIGIGLGIAIIAVGLRFSNPNTALICLGFLVLGLGCLPLALAGRDVWEAAARANHKHRSTWLGVAIASWAGAIAGLLIPVVLVIRSLTRAGRHRSSGQAGGLPPTGSPRR